MNTTEKKKTFHSGTIFTLMESVVMAKATIQSQAGHTGMVGIKAGKNKMKS